MPGPTPTPLPSGFKEALSRATDSWMDHRNAKILASPRYREPGREQFMEDIGKGWIVPEDWNPDAGELGWGLAVGNPRYREALEMSVDREELAIPEDAGRQMSQGFRSDRGRAGRYMGRGSLGTPVYVDPGLYGAKFQRRLKGEYEGKMKAFAPEERYVTTGGPSTGAMGHELGHAKQHIMEDPYVSEWDREPGRKYFRKERYHGSARDPGEAAAEAVAGYLGRRIIRSKKGWGAAAEDKSWAAYSGLPSYLGSLDDNQLKSFTDVVRDYEDQYPGIYDETMRVIREYDTLVAPKTINDTSKGDWSEEGLKFMKEWRKKKGLKEVPKGSLQNRARQMGPYSRALKSAGPNRLA
jgi:hypothetical protein